MSFLIKMKYHDVFMRDGKGRVTKDVDTAWGFATKEGAEVARNDLIFKGEIKKQDWFIVHEEVLYH